MSAIAVESPAAKIHKGISRLCRGAPRFARSRPDSLCCNAVLQAPESVHGFKFDTTRATVMTQTAQQSRETEIKELIQRRLRQLAPLLRGHRVYLFGSRARGRARPRSDFDIGVLGEEPLSLRDFYAIEEALDELPTLFRIDWVDLNRAPPQFRERAMQAAEILYE